MGTDIAFLSRFPCFSFRARNFPARFWHPLSFLPWLPSHPFHPSRIQHPRRLPSLSSRHSSSSRATKISYDKQISARSLPRNDNVQKRAQHDIHSTPGCSDTERARRENVALATIVKNQTICVTSPLGPRQQSLGARKTPSALSLHFSPSRHLFVCSRHIASSLVDFAALRANCECGLGLDSSRPGVGLFRSLALVEHKLQSNADRNNSSLACSPFIIAFCRLQLHEHRISSAFAHIAWLGEARRTPPRRSLRVHCHCTLPSKPDAKPARARQGNEPQDRCSSSAPNKKLM